MDRFHPLRLLQAARDAIVGDGQVQPTSVPWIPWNKLHVGEKLGSGECGVVYQANLLPDSGTVAIKKLHQNFGDPILLKHELWQEASVMAKLHHPNIIALHGVASSSTEDNFPWLVMECMPGGDLCAALHADENKLSWESRVVIASQVALAMEYLHSMRFIHFDLKSSNLLLDMSNPLWPVCKVGDFGFSREKKGDMGFMHGEGSVGWMAPEVIGDGEVITEKVDVYSFGMVMWELLTGKEPYEGDELPEVPEWCDPLWKKLMEECLAGDATKRPAFVEVTGRLQEMVAALPEMGGGRKYEALKVGFSAAAEMGMKLFSVMGHIVALCSNFVATLVIGVGHGGGQA